MAIEPVPLCHTCTQLDTRKLAGSDSLDFKARIVANAALQKLANVRETLNAPANALADEVNTLG